MPSIEPHSTSVQREPRLVLCVETFATSLARPHLAGKLRGTFWHCSTLLPSPIGLKLPPCPRPLERSRDNRFVRSSFPLGLRWRRGPPAQTALPGFHWVLASKWVRTTCLSLSIASNHPFHNVTSACDACCDGKVIRNRVEMCGFAR